MKKTILAMAVALMVVAMLVTPVLAIGPFQALDVDNNKNLKTIRGAGVSNGRGNAGGSIYLLWIAGDQHWIRWVFQDASQTKGLMNNAIIAQFSGLPSEMTAYFLSLNSEENSNKWIYLSSDGGTNPSQYNGHGMLYWWSYGIVLLSGGTQGQARAFAAGSVAIYPEGSFWMHNDIYAPP